MAAWTPKRLALSAALATLLISAPRVGFAETIARPEPTVLRVRTGRIEPGALKARLHAQGFHLRDMEGLPGFFQVEEGPRPVTFTLEHWHGLFYVQQASTGVAAPVLAPEPGERVLDLCSAPGGKTTHAADLMKDRGSLVAVEVSEPRIRGLLGNVYRLTRTQVRDVMVPREDVLAIARNIESDDLLDLLRGTGFTRLPVYDGTLDDVVGILHTKDLFHVYARERVVILEDALRPAMFIRSDLAVTDALRQFRRGRRHLAVVRDGDGPVLGVCTLEDVLEEIVGEIEDEHDRPTPAGSE